MAVVDDKTVYLQNQKHVLHEAQGDKSVPAKLQG